MTMALQILVLPPPLLVALLVPARCPVKPGSLVGALLICVALATGCSRKPAQAGPGAPEVLVTTVAQRDVPVVNEGVATLDGLVNATISAQVSGHIVSQEYKEGSFVKKGDLLFQIDPRPFEHALAQAKATLAKAQANQLKAEQDEKRALSLANTGALSQQALDADVAAAAAARADTASAEAAVKDAELNLEYTRVTAPIDGVAGFATAQVGDLVGPSTQPLTTVSQIDPMKATVSAGEQAYITFESRFPDPAARAVYEKTLEFELILSNGSVYPHKGKFYAMDRALDAKTGAIHIEVTFPNPAYLLRPGQFGRVRAVTDTKKNALLVPQEAVTELQGNYQVAVVDNDNKATIRPVKMGERFGAMWEVTEGLKPGERVIVEGIQKVHDGSPVLAKNWSPPAPAVAAEGGNEKRH